MEKNLLAVFRGEMGMTQKQLAEAIGVSRNYVALVERGKKPLSQKLTDKLYRLSPNTNLLRSANQKAAHLVGDNQPIYDMINVASGARSQQTTPCLECLRKTKEIERLTTIISNLSEALASVKK